MKSYKDKLRFEQKLELLKQVEIPIESIALMILVIQLM